MICFNSILHKTDGRHQFLGQDSGCWERCQWRPENFKGGIFSTFSGELRVEHQMQRGEGVGTPNAGWVGVGGGVE